jgi:hypothetical protein
MLESKSDSPQCHLYNISCHLPFIISHNTALNLSAMFGHIEVCQLLVSAKADITLKSRLRKFLINALNPELTFYTTGAAKLLLILRSKTTCLTSPSICAASKLPPLWTAEEKADYSLLNKRFPVPININVRSSYQHISNRISQGYRKLREIHIQQNVTTTRTQLSWGCIDVKERTFVLRSVVRLVCKIVLSVLIKSLQRAVGNSASSSAAGSQ